MPREKTWVLATGSGGSVVQAEFPDGSKRDCIDGYTADGRRVFISVPRRNDMSQSEALYRLAARLVEIAQKRERTESERIGYAYRDALAAVPGATVTAFERFPGDETLGAFVVQVAFPNGYGVSVARSRGSYGGEIAAVTRHGHLLRSHGSMPELDTMPSYNECRLADADHAVEIAREVASLPAPTDSEV